MATQQLLGLRPTPGRFADTVQVLKADRAWEESHGITRAWASVVMHGGPGTGMIGYFLDGEDSQSDGKALDAMQAAYREGGPPPLIAAMLDPDPPFIEESAVIRVEITPTPPSTPEPDPPRTGFTTAIMPTPGRMDDVQQVLADYMQFANRLGVHARIYSLSGAGPLSGVIHASVYAKNWEDLGRLADRAREEGPTPIIAAVTSANPPATLIGTASTAGIDIS